eukprot:6299424-Pyramimonas_sp.AAC.1
MGCSGRTKPPARTTRPCSRGRGLQCDRLHCYNGAAATARRWLSWFEAPNPALREQPGCGESAQKPDGMSHLSAPRVR